jgi:uncharacterized protein (TIGR02246 family)
MSTGNSNALKVIGLACVFALGISSAQAADVRSAIKATNTEMSTVFAKGDAAAVAALYMPEGEVLPVGSDPIKGTEAIQKFWQGAMSSGVASVTLKTVELYPAGSTATEVGEYELADKSGKKLDHGKYIVIWRKSGEQWKLLRDMFSTNVAPAK